ncbi:cobalamin biosynthesis protein CobG [Sulfitobacter sp. LCG007]
MRGAGEVRGWCPGALRPMQSGDGLVVRIRPWLGRLSRDQALGLCDLALGHGSGFIDLTSRANLQIRGVTQAAYPALMEGLGKLGLLDPDPESEARRNITVAPFWQAGDRSYRLARELGARLDELPLLPGKFGFAIDLGPAAMLANTPADIRLETGPRDSIQLRADSCDTGVELAERDAITRAIALARWFSGRMTPDARRMRKVVQYFDLPKEFIGTSTAVSAPRPDPGPVPGGTLIGVPFGQADAAALAAAIRSSGAQAISVTPWRMLRLDGARAPAGDAFIVRPADPLLDVDACPGAPFCASASVETRSLARRLAARSAGALHVSGCAKGCARARPAPLTLVGRDGAFDLVENGTAWDEPRQRGLDPETILKSFA